MITKELTLNMQILKDQLCYDDMSGIFYWKNKRQGRRAGCLARNSNSNKKYWTIYLNGYNYMAHRVVWFYKFNEWPKQIDHIDGNGLNNRIENLRDVCGLENQKNKKLYTCNKSGVSGVYPRNSKWRSVIRHKGHLKHIGTYNGFFEAVCARKSAENKYGFHENHGTARPL